MRDVIILAGGMGTRLQSVVRDMPKPMADINGRPFLELLLDHLVNQRVSRVVLSVGYRNEDIRNHFGLKYRGITIVYSVEEKPLGTGGGIVKAMEYTNGNNVIVLNGDTFFPIDLSDLMDFHCMRSATVTLALKQIVNSNRFDSVNINTSGAITAIMEKGTGGNLINGGIYAVNRDLLLLCEFPERFSFESDFLKTAYRDGNFFGKEYNAYFIDIGIPEAYLKFVDMVSTGSVWTIRNA